MDELRKNSRSARKRDRAFIGGAERARREARKRLYKQEYKQQNQHYLPKSVKPLERFFASLLQTSISDLSDESRREKVMLEVCKRVNLPLPAPLPACYKDAQSFYSSRASLVLEESRHVLSEALRKNSPTTNCATQALLVCAKEKSKTGHLVLTFEPNEQSTCQIDYGESMKPGTVYRIQPNNGNRKNENGGNENTILASFVTTKSNTEHDDFSFSVMVFQSKVDVQHTQWTIHPLTNLISHVRQFEACTNYKTNVAFLPKLIGWKEPTHIKFQSDSSDEEGSDDDDDELLACNLVDRVSKPTGISLPELNTTQEKAATAFLNSPPSTLTLVQGPPGTGKTTFMVSVLCRCLLQSNKSKRILVTAPTNKAITVLATRFLDAFQENTDYNIVMIGVQDKLVGKEEWGGQSAEKGGHSLESTSKLGGIFVYTWMQCMIHDLKLLRNDLDSRWDSRKDLIERARGLTQKLMQGIPQLLKSCGTHDLALEFVNLLEQLADMNQKDEKLADKPEVILLLDSLIVSLALVENETDEIVRELLATAHVIFCTLSSSGVASMKQTRRIDDLLIDEAAAATEPELCIPFHLGPTRMLAVGDPMQLPATVMSRHASDLGLNKSMHERLMYDCKREYVMLNVQYRMKPEISMLPSTQFYGGELCNGENVVRPEYKSNSTLFGGAPYLFFQVNGREQRNSGDSLSNRDEAVTVVNMVKALCPSSSSTTEPWYSPNRIRIITFYQGQVALINRLLRRHGLGRVLVATVDSSQGCEADVVIVSFVRSNSNSRGGIHHTAGFLADDRRINVALTRARYQLICVGDASGTLSQSGSATLKALVDDAKERMCLSAYDADRAREKDTDRTPD